MTSTDRIELERALIEALGPAALNCPDQDCRSLQWDDIVRVSDFDVTQASWCQAKVAGPPEPFAADIFKTYRAIALRAAKHLTADSSPTSVVSAVMKNLPGSRDWLGEYARTSPTSVRIQTATRAVSWLTRTAELLGTDSLADHRFDQNFDWKYPGHGSTRQLRQRRLNSNTCSNKPISSVGRFHRVHRAALEPRCEALFRSRSGPSALHR
jgi:hypothetical protein